VSRWLSDGAFRSWAEDHLSGRHAKLKHLFRPKEMQRHIARASAGDHNAANITWALIVLETWLREYGVDVETSAPESGAVPAVVYRELPAV
jgi:hypothetical protein